MKLEQHDHQSINKSQNKPSALFPPSCGRFHHNQNHHIYDNQGTLWLHCTVHRPDYTKQRVRVSLRTKDMAVARRRRDFAMRNIPGVVGVPEKLVLADFRQVRLQEAA
jgi:hypothetical protein